MQTVLYNNTLCVEASALFAGGVISPSNYKQQVARGFITVVRRGCKGTPALVCYKSLPTRFKTIFIEKTGVDPLLITPQSHFERYILEDAVAKKYYSEIETPTGGLLKPENQTEYYNNAIILNAIKSLLNNRANMRKTLGNKPKGLWEGLSEAVNALSKQKYPHTLPTNQRRLQARYKGYIKDSYGFLIHKGFGNVNGKVVTELLEQLILSVYCMGNKPYSKWVHEDYLKFIAGTIEVIDMKTGEILDRANFYDPKTNAPIMISEATCWNIINNPKNRAIVDSLRMTSHRYRSLVQPHNHRVAAHFGLNKISLDDRDLPRKLHNGNRVKAYYAYDVASGCLIGSSYSLKKDNNLFIDCLRDMFRFINKNGFGMPMEVEVEHHLVSNFKDGLMSAGVVFPFVRWCAPSNSQEKHAENFNRIKKYTVEKRNQSNIGRFYAKDEANVTGGERVYDEIAEKYIIKEKTYSYQELVADDLQTIFEYNNKLHSNQIKYKGKTRLQVLIEHVNPDLPKINPAVLARYIGVGVDTSIRRNQYCQVNYAKYMLPSPEVLGRLTPNNYNVTAYYIPNETHIINEVYLYQNQTFLATCAKIEVYSTAIVERTQKDLDAKKIQDDYIAEYNRMVHHGTKDLAAVKLLKNEMNYNELIPEIVPQKELKPEYAYDYQYSGSALDNL